MAVIHDYQVDLSADTSHARAIRLTGSGKHVLEFGRAVGYVAKILTEQSGCAVTGIELVPGAVAKARLVCQRLICGDAEALAYEKELDDERFDVVLFGDSLEHPRNSAAVLSIPDIAHAAVALEQVAGQFSYPPLGLLDDTHMRFLSRRSIYELFESTGYVIAELSRIEIAPASTEFQNEARELPAEGGGVRDDAG